MFVQAYFYGFFKHKRIVIFDTLINQATIPEVVAVLGHELGNKIIFTRFFQLVCAFRSQATY
jgi:hypothetical protein